MAGNGNDLRDRHIGELFAQLGSEATTLVRQEMELARAELRERVEAARGELHEAVELARDETAQKLDEAKRDIAAKGRAAGGGLAMFGVAHAAGIVALGTLSAALVLLLNRWLDADLAALLTAAAWGLVAAAAALRGRDRMQEAADLDPGRYVPRRTIETVRDDLRKLGDVESLKPEHTLETLKEDVEWAKTRGRSDATSSRRAHG